MNRIATLLQDMIADVAAAIWLARYPGSNTLAAVLDR